MMIDPPIDKLVDKVGCKYALVCLLTKRARFLINKKSEMLAENAESAITCAARELQGGKIMVGYEN
ncbi:MAG: DNA-directed RNA polymerase subunit omega [Firmicutes bacterium]|nr:DNA-directed RNA polymerase subunit omega [Bacillota bacterium]